MLICGVALLQPLSSITVTVYWPAGTVKLACAWNGSVLNAYCKTPVPPLALTVIFPLLMPLHGTFCWLLTLIFRAAGIVTVKFALEVLPLLSLAHAVWPPAARLSKVLMLKKLT